MTCKCGYQNREGAKDCAWCGRKLHHGKGPHKKWLAIAAVCLLIAGIGIGNLLPLLSGSRQGADPQQKESGNFRVGQKAEIAQVLPVEDGSVAVRYTDGSVEVSGNSPFSGMVSDWENVEKLYYNNIIDYVNGEILDFPVLFGLTKDGCVLSTDGSLSGWSNVKELHFVWNGIVGITRDGQVLAEGEWEDASFLTDLSEVETLVNNGEIWGCLKKDGSVRFVSDDPYMDGNLTRWRNVKELRASDHGFYAIMKDGTLEGQFDDTYAGLKDAAKVVDFEDWLFGISADGRLMTHNSGNIYTNTGDMVVDVPGLPYYGEEIDISCFNQVRDILPFGGLILLNKDGTVQFLGAYPEWDFSNWNDIQKVYGVWDEEGIVECLYGIRQDGSVILNRYDQSAGRQTVTDRYRGWKLKELYCAEGGVIGLTADGSLVGDGIYENVNFAVFER